MFPKIGSYRISYVPEEGSPTGRVLSTWMESYQKNNVTVDPV